MIPVTYSPAVVEEAVLLAERTAAADVARAFRRARDGAYAIADPDAREKAFQQVHQKWFARFGLNGVIEQALDSADLSARVSQCRVLRAVREQDEGADVFDRATARGERDRRPLLVLNIRPALLLDEPSLSRLLRHELMHVSDMLDPAFGYLRVLPVSDDGVSADNIARDRYRVLWDVTIDGRLARAGHDTAATRALRACEFAAAFPMLGDSAAETFERWFHTIVPTHAQLVTFVMQPPAATPTAHQGRCPLCRFPVTTLDRAPERLSSEARHRIEREHPGWHIGLGLCAQCLDLYEAQPTAEH